MQKVDNIKIEIMLKGYKILKTYTTITSPGI